MCARETAQPGLHAHKDARAHARTRALKHDFDTTKTVMNTCVPITCARARTQKRMQDVPQPRVGGSLQRGHDLYVKEKIGGNYHQFKLYFIERERRVGRE
jgi:hypothetical protein